MCNSFNKKFIDEASQHWSGHDLDRGSGELGYMKQAVDLALSGMEKNEGGPFGCIIVKDGEIIGRGNNKVTSKNDPTAHAEILAIREACEKLQSHQLDGCTLYTSCEPCPMCLGAIYWARPDRVYYAGTKKDAARIGFDDDFIYREIEKAPGERKISFRQIGREEALKAFAAWDAKDDKIEY